MAPTPASLALPSYKNFLVVSGARGLGRGLSRAILELKLGNRFFLVDNNERELTHTIQLLNQVRAPRVNQVDSFAGNLHEDRNILEAMKQAAGFFDWAEGDGNGGLDVLINTAPGDSQVTFQQLPRAIWESMITENLTIPMLFTQLCLPLFRKRGGGCIINVSSTYAFTSEPNCELLATTKAGLLGLTQSLAVTLARDNIRVNAIVTGWIHASNECKDADECWNSWDDGVDQDDHDCHLTGKVGDVSHVAQAVMYLAENPGVTGSELVVDGGVSRKMVLPESNFPRRPER